MGSPTKVAKDVSHAGTVTVSRVWLVSLISLVLAPWVVVGVVYSGALVPDSPAEPSAARARVVLDPGPWGRLSLAPIIVSPPIEYVTMDEAAPVEPVWFLPGVSIDQLEALLTSTGLDAQTAARLRATARSDPASAGIIVRPDRTIVRALTPDVRGRLYLLLARAPQNGRQAHSYRFLGASPDAWFAGASMTGETRRIVESLIYRDGEVLHFADLDLARERVTDREEARRLAKALLRQSTVMVRLHLPSVTDVPALAEYWGRGGRKTDLRPLLESVAHAAEPERSIDIVHLLPAFARNVLYRYPQLTPADLDKPVIANCLWTALSFFLPEPDDRALDVTYALTRLKTNYYLVETDFQLGDVVAFLDTRDNLFHVAVYLADNLLLTKNGMSPMAPWIIQSIDQVKAYYRTRAANPQLLVHRRKDF